MNKKIVFLLLLFSLMIPFQTLAQAPRPLEPASLDDLPGLEAFLDGVFATHLKAYHIPGAMIAIVRDGAPYFSKGYGYADIDRQIPVDAQRTLFRPGSVSKLFVWTSVMQLVEQGKLDLDADVRSLVDFRLPTSCSQPISLRHLMSHTPGFEDKVVGLFVSSVDSRLPLDVFLRTNAPECIYPPGEVPAYSNYGTALAAYLVERISGMPFEEYVDVNILTPLGMENSTFRQPVFSRLKDDLALGYAYSGGGYIAGNFEVVNAYPAGSLSATAADMARFMIAHLQNGQYEQVRILQEATAQLMHTRHYAYDPRASGWAYGFMEQQWNGLRWIGHGGDTFLFHSELLLQLEQNVGIYVSYNAAGGSKARSELIKAFMDRYFPAGQPPAQMPLNDTSSRMAQVVGEYQVSRRNESGPEKLLAMMQPVIVSRTGSGFLQVNLGGMGQTQWIEVEPYVFQERYGSDRLFFSRDQSGRVDGAFLENNQTLVVSKTPWYASITFIGVLLSAWLLLGLSVFVFWPVIYFATRSRAAEAAAAQKQLPPRRLARLARWIAALFYALSFIFVFVFLGALADMDPAYQIPRLILAFPAWVSTWFGIPWLLTLLALVMLVMAVMSWTGIGDPLDRPYWGLVGRLHYSLLALTALGFVWFCFYWRLVAPL